MGLIFYIFLSLQIEAQYDISIAEQASQVAEVRMDEQLIIPSDIDYFALVEVSIKFLQFQLKNFSFVFL